MKKSLIALSLTALVFASCKKETTPAAFTPTDMTGTGWVKGNTSKNIVTPGAGTGLWISTGRVPAAGVNVTVRVPKSGGVGVGLYPNSTSQGSDVYTGTTDAQGNYAISVKTNGSGVQAQITIDGFTGTLDTLINGVKKTGLYGNFVGTGPTNRSVWTGQTSWLDYQFNASNLTTNPNSIQLGSAQVTGSVSRSLYTQSTTANSQTVGPVPSTVMIVPTNTAVAGITVYLDFNMDPLNLVTKSYQTTTDATGNYIFSNITTVPQSLAGAGFPSQTGTIWVADHATTRDTVKLLSTYNGTAQVGVTSTVITTGKPGIYNSQTNIQAGLYNNEIRNATNLNFSAGSFVPN